jgi:hypothetical protein
MHWPAMTWQNLETIKLTGTRSRVTPPLTIAARSFANLLQFGISLYALYSNVPSSSIVISFAFSTLLFNVIEVAIEALWPPHRIQHHEIRHTNVVRSAMPSSFALDLERGISATASMDEHGDIQLVELPPPIIEGEAVSFAEQLAPLPCDWNQLDLSETVPVKGGLRSIKSTSAIPRLVVDGSLPTWIDDVRSVKSVPGTQNHAHFIV